jgi:hypothetical protein
VTVTVTPAAFTLVDFDGARIAEVFAAVARGLGLAPELAISVVVDELSPLTGGGLRSLDPVVIALDGGALEDRGRLRQLDQREVAVQAGRYLGRLRDRRDPEFGEPPAEDLLTLAQADAWDAYALGRLSRMGFDARQPRWRYRFRTRHGFSDAVDLVFDGLWASARLTWPDLEAACARTEAAREQSRQVVS